MAKGSFIFAMNRRKAIAVTEAEEVTVTVEWQNQSYSCYVSFVLR